MSAKPEPLLQELVLSRPQLGAALERLASLSSLEELRHGLDFLELQVSHGRLRGDEEEIALGTASWQRQLQQIREARTLQRAQYYLERLHRGVCREKTSRLNDINLYRWQEYEDILTDSLWSIEKRDRSGAHTAGYWGNYIPQIPNQMLRRYTKPGDWVLDPFLGSGTTLLESQRLGRNGLGLELQPEVAAVTQQRLNSEANPHGVTSLVRVGNSAKADFRQLLEEGGVSSVQLAMLHPPYHDIIRFSEREECLSNCGGTEEFLDRLADVGQAVHKVLDKGRYLALVIGDKYSDSEWIPLGFQSMQRLAGLGFQLKSIIVKNFEQTAGKRAQKELWRYRALVGGFYVFKHEYIFLMQRI